MTAEEIRILPIAEKCQIMEMIWEDFRERVEKFELSPEHKALLDERRARVTNGDAKLRKWDDVKSSIGRR
jgi:putative addiction module component (TIGR02574 family)